MPKRQSEPTGDTAGRRPDDDELPTRATGDDPAERRCLNCGALFLSEGWHNRLCRGCARRS